MSAALHIIVRLMPFNLKVEQIESRTASWNGLCSTFEGPLYSSQHPVTKGTPGFTSIQNETKSYFMHLTVHDISFLKFK
jgi:hypothetical protein